MAPQPKSPSVLVIGCGALARELLDVIRFNGLVDVSVECLPAILHNRPEKIPAAIEARLEKAIGFDRILVAYGDCGTGGSLDDVLARYGVERLPGAHCYEFYATSTVFDSLADEEPGTFFLTDYLARHFERIVWRGLGLDRWPELRDDYFGNYRRVVYLAQSDDPELTARARDGAAKLGLDFERRLVGYGELAPTLVRISSARSAVA